MASQRNPYVPVKDLPSSLQAALRGVGYARPDIELGAAESFRPNEGSAVFEGNRGYVVTVNLATGKHAVAVGDWSGPGLGRKQVDFDREPQAIPPGGAVIIGESGGRGSFARIKVHPDSLTPMLPAGSEISAEEKKALKIIKETKSSYRADAFRRAGLGVYTPAFRNQILLSLQAKGLVTINKAGSVTITTDGKNAAVANPRRPASKAQTEWSHAIMEGRFATADYLEGELPQERSRMLRSEDRPFVSGTISRGQRSQAEQIRDIMEGHAAEFDLPEDREGLLDAARQNLRQAAKVQKALNGPLDEGDLGDLLDHLEADFLEIINELERLGYHAEARALLRGEVQPNPSSAKRMKRMMNPRNY